jgi:hypothetical protein
LLELIYLAYRLISVLTIVKKDFYHVTM